MHKFRIGVAQVAQTGDIEVNIAKALDYIDQAAAHKIDLVCFPETHLPGYRVGIITPDAPCDQGVLDAALNQIRARAKEHGIGIIMGTETPNPGSRPFNSAVVIGRDGELIATHHKSRLTPRDEVGYAVGEAPTLFEFDGVKMGLVICFEGFRFPENSRMLASQGAKIIFHPQFNHIWEGAEWKLPVHEALIVARAAENTAFFVSANMAHERNTCRSLIVRPNGVIAAASELAQEMLIEAEVDLDEATHAILSSDPNERMKVLAEIV